MGIFIALFVILAFNRDIGIFVFGLNPSNCAVNNVYGYLGNAKSWLIKSFDYIFPFEIHFYLVMFSSFLRKLDRSPAFLTSEDFIR